MRKIQILILLAAAVGAAWLTTLVDDGLGAVWTHNVVRNWEQFGFFNLHGKMVINPGGFEAATNPEIYAGHRPASLYPAYVCHHVSGASDFGFLAYYAVMAAIVLLSIWQLLGHTERAFWLAVTAVLTPGYLRWQTSLDPNLTAVLFGYPFCVAVIGWLRRPVLTRLHWLGLFLLILVYSSLNWTTIFVHAMLFATLLVLPGVSWRRLLIYAGLTAALAGLVLLASLATKLRPAGAGSGGGLALMVRAYGWGNAGYGLDLTTKTAFTRLLAVNFMGLLPVLIFLGCLFWRRGLRRSPAGWLWLAPLLMPVVEVTGMRNYFGHHPWMSVNFFLMGIILAAAVWRAETESVSAGDSQIRLPLRLGCLAATFAYSFLVLTAQHQHNEGELKLAALIREHTARDFTIVVRRDTDPALADIAPRLPEMFDRHLIVVPDLTAASLAQVPEKRVVLTAVAPPAETSIAQTGDAGGGNPVLKKMLGWYARHIAHRRPGDKLELDGNYYLCRSAG